MYDKFSIAIEILILFNWNFVCILGRLILGMKCLLQ